MTIQKTAQQLLRTRRTTLKNVLPAGSKIVITTGKHRGAKGEVKAWLASRARYVVSLESGGQQLEVKTNNLISVAALLKRAQKKQTTSTKSEKVKKEVKQETAFPTKETPIPKTAKPVTSSSNSKHPPTRPSPAKKPTTSNNNKKLEVEEGEPDVPEGLPQDFFDDALNPSMSGRQVKKRVQQETIPKETPVKRKRPKRGKGKKKKRPRQLTDKQKIWLKRQKEVDNKPKIQRRTIQNENPVVVGSADVMKDKSRNKKRTIADSQSDDTMRKFEKEIQQVTQHQQVGSRQLKREMKKRFKKEATLEQKWLVDGVESLRESYERQKNTVKVKPESMIKNEEVKMEDGSTADTSPDSGDELDDFIDMDWRQKAV